MREGTRGYDYHEERRSQRARVYRLARRTDEVRRAVEAYSQRRVKDVLNIGTAAGLMLTRLHDRWPGMRYIGLDMSRVARRL